MFDQLFVAINSWMVDSFALAAAGCFLWGVVSVLFSPCHLASIPLMVGYVAGQGRLIEGREAARYAVVFTRDSLRPSPSSGGLFAFGGACWATSAPTGPSLWGPSSSGWPWTCWAWPSAACPAGSWGGSR